MPVCICLPINTCLQLFCRQVLLQCMHYIYHSSQHQQTRLSLSLSLSLEKKKIDPSVHLSFQPIASHEHEILMQSHGFFNFFNFSLRNALRCFVEFDPESPKRLLPILLLLRSDRPKMRGKRKWRNEASLENQNGAFLENRGPRYPLFEAGWRRKGGSVSNLRAT